MKFDAIIIGFGKAGKTLAGFLAKKGEKVALIERSEKMYGGTCINIGCIPTKTLVHSAHLARRDASWKEKQEYFRGAMAQKDAVVSFLREKNYEKLADDPNVTIFLGVGSFAGKNSVEVRGKDSAVTLEAPKIFINTGSETVPGYPRHCRESARLYEYDAFRPQGTAAASHRRRRRLHWTRIRFNVCFFRHAGHGARKGHPSIAARRPRYCCSRAGCLGK